MFNILWKIPWHHCTPFGDEAHTSETAHKITAFEEPQWTRHHRVQWNCDNQNVSCCSCGLKQSSLPSSIKPEKYHPFPHMWNKSSSLKNNYIQESLQSSGLECHNIVLSVLSYIPLFFYILLFFILPIVNLNISIQPIKHLPVISEGVSGVTCGLQWKSLWCWEQFLICHSESFSSFARECRDQKEIRYIHHTIHFSMINVRFLEPSRHTSDSFTVTESFQSHFSQRNVKNKSKLRAALSTGRPGRHGAQGECFYSKILLL